MGLFYVLMAPEKNLHLKNRCGKQDIRTNNRIVTREMNF